MTDLSHRPEFAGITAAADALAQGKTTSVALCQAMADRHAEVDETVNGYLQFDLEKALAAAEASDQRRRDGAPLSQFDGVPIAMKDNFAVDGETCGCASKILETFTATYDATVVTRLKDAGFVLLGRTNMDEFAMGSSTEHSAYGMTRNPHNTEHVPGGSSGGSAAVVASGQALAALGSDTGGSIRQPAGFCGVVGMKPTYGRISRYGLVAFASSLDQIGPITHTVEDAAALLDVIGGHDTRDCTTIPQACEGFAEALKTASIKGMRVGMPREFFEVDGLDDDVRAAVEKVRDAMTEAGAEPVEVHLPHLKYGVAAYYVIATAEASSNLSRFEGIRYGNRSADAKALEDVYFKTREAGFGDEVKRRIMLGTYVLSSGYYDAFYLRAQKVRTVIRNDFAEAFKACDVILSPVAPTPAFKLGAMTDPLQMYLSDIYTISVNLAGICGISVPCGSASNGLPLGVQFIGNAMEEKKILTAAHWLECDAALAYSKEGTA
jgi:aspartyl-tRNA(Asn)/glutamyl-tRNA(Gln) amidotransferase subunit A